MFLCLSVSCKNFLMYWTNTAQSEGRRQISKRISNFKLFSSAPTMHFHAIYHVPTGRKTALPAQPNWRPEMTVGAEPPSSDPWGSLLRQFCCSQEYPVPFHVTLSSLKFQALEHKDNHQEYFSRSHFKADKETHQ